MDPPTMSGADASNSTHSSVDPEPHSTTARPSGTATNTAARAFAIPHVLQNIITQLENDDLSKCATVGRSWYEHAARFLFASPTIYDRADGSLKIPWPMQPLAEGQAAGPGVLWAQQVAQSRIGEISLQHSHYNADTEMFDNTRCQGAYDRWRSIMADRRLKVDTLYICSNTRYLHLECPLVRMFDFDHLIIDQSERYANFDEDHKLHGQLRNEHEASFAEDRLGFDVELQMIMQPDKKEPNACVTMAIPDCPPGTAILIGLPDSPTWNYHQWDNPFHASWRNALAEALAEQLRRLPEAVYEIGGASRLAPHRIGAYPSRTARNFPDYVKELCGRDKWVDKLNVTYLDTGTDSDEESGEEWEVW